MTSAEERIKEAFPDWEEWPEWAVDLTVKTMKEYALEVAQDALDRAAESTDGKVFVRKIIEKTPIILT